MPSISISTRKCELCSSRFSIEIAIMRKDKSCFAVHLCKSCIEQLEKALSESKSILDPNNPKLELIEFPKYLLKGKD